MCLKSFRIARKKTFDAIIFYVKCLFTLTLYTAQMYGVSKQKHVINVYHIT